VVKIREFEAGLYKYLDANASDLLNEITEKKDITKDIEKNIKKVLEDYKKSIS